MTSLSITINYTDFKTNNLKFTKLEENERSNGQLVGYPRYTKNGQEIPLEIQLPWIKLFTYGVPRINQYYKTDGDRAHLRVPLDLSIPEVKEFSEMLKDIDRMMESPEMKETLFGRKSKKYKYQPLFREGYSKEDDGSDEDEDDTNIKKKSNSLRPPYFKLKIKLSYPDKKVETKVYKSDKNNETDKRTREQVDVISVNDFSQIIRYLSLVRAIMKIIKIWAHSLTKKDPEYGIVCRLERIEVDSASISGGLYNSVYDSEKFIDSDDEKLPTINMKISEVTKNKEIVKEEIKDNEDVKDKDSSDDSSDDEKIINPKAKENIVEIDSESDSDSEDEKILKPSSKVVEVKSDDSDDDEVVITKPPPKTKKATKNSKSKNNN